MMPDKNEVSDNTPEQPVEDSVVDDQVVSEQGSAAEDTTSESVTSAATQTGDADQSVEAAVVAEQKSADSDSDAADENDQSSVDDPEAEAEDELTILRKQLQEAEGRASENWERLLRLQAEMENQRKRAQNDVNKARKFALEGIVGDLLPVKDSLEMGLTAAQAEDADPNALIEGVQLTLKQLSQAFEKNNIIEVNPVDEKFDPEFHQAMSMQEVEGKAPNTVTSVMQKGYTLNERLVRPALVMVAK